MNWIKNKWGRFVSILGGLGTLASTALEWAQEHSEDWVPNFITLTNTKIAAGLSIALLFFASYLRHRKAAKTVADLKAQIDDLRAQITK